MRTISIFALLALGACDIDGARQQEADEEQIFQRDEPELGGATQQQDPFVDEAKLNEDRQLEPVEEPVYEVED